MSTFSRRRFLQHVIGGVLLSAVGAPLLSACKDTPTNPQPNQSDPQPLRIPTTVTSGISIGASYGASQVWPGTASNVLQMNGTYLGPTIRVRKGDRFTSDFHNMLGEPSIIHWHGLSSPTAMDGHPKYQIQSGESLHYDFPILDRAGTYWYHAHPDGLTAKQAYMGLAGVFIVDDAESDALNLPSGAYDIPLVLQDKAVTTGTNDMVYAPSHEDIITGYLGNHVLVNGTPNAFLGVDRGLYRFRLINGSNARVYQMGFADARVMKLVGNDGGLLPTAQSVTSFNLSPGERADVIVDFGNDPVGGSVKLKSIAYDFVSEHRGDTYPQGMELSVLDCRIGSKVGFTGVVPSNLSTVLPYKPSDAVNSRVFLLTMDHSKAHGIHTINGVVFSMDRVDVTVKQGDLELWEFQNTGDGFHSMHVHGAHFQIAERLYAGTMQPIDRGWKDTVLVYPNETVRILIRFNDYKGLYLLHCHTLEHEDDGMMLNVQIV